MWEGLYYKEVNRDMKNDIYTHFQSTSGKGDSKVVAQHVSDGWVEGKFFCLSLFGKQVVSPEYLQAVHSGTGRYSLGCPLSVLGTVLQFSQNAYLY